MSQEPISRSPDLKRLLEDGYEVEIRFGHLIVRSVPYVNARREIHYGLLASPLELAGDIAKPPSSHVAFFAGEAPCHKDGTAIHQIVNASDKKVLAPGLEIDHTFSSKPISGRYVDFYEKMTTYVKILSAPAEALDSNVTARSFRVIEAPEDSSPFCYIDTASSRAGISSVASKLVLSRLALVGVGGTGSYVLDLVAKTPVQEVHLFDGDRFGSHNAFRAPGAASLEELREYPMKVDYFTAKYSHMHRHIIPHPYYLEAANAGELATMDFVFLCLDASSEKKAIVEVLEQSGKRFIDVGMGIEEVDGSLGGILRVTTSTEQLRDHVRQKNRIPFVAGKAEDDYNRNIQVADLNALNATLAVVKWKKLCGFYRDYAEEHHSTYTLDCNMLLSEDRLC